MDTERNKANVRRIFEEGFTLGHLDVVDECIAPDGIDRHEFAADEPNFPAHLKGVITMVRTAMPDVRMSVEDIVGEGDRVAVRVLLTGTHTGGPVFGIPATGRSVRVEQFHIIQCNDAGLGTVHWANIGEHELLGQLTAAAAVPAGAVG